MSIKATVKRNLGKFLPRSLRKRFGMAHKKRRGRR
jgi:hypothetical protein